jgi:O-antigen/teichoic acid export membrane protein
VSSAVFPVFAACHRSSPERNRREYTRSLKLLVVILFPPLCVAAVFAPELLHLWLNAEFARESAPVVRWLVVGILLNCLAFIPSALVQAAGRPDLTTLLHVIECSLYLPAIWFLTRAEGNVGAAMAWTGRAGVDAIALFWVARKFLPRAPGRSHLFPIVATACAAMVVGMLLTGLRWKLLFLGLTLPLFLGAVWTRALDANERTALLRLIMRQRSRAEA